VTLPEQLLRRSSSGQASPNRLRHAPAIGGGGSSWTAVVLGAAALLLSFAFVLGAEGRLH